VPSEKLKSLRKFVGGVSGHNSFLCGVRKRGKIESWWRDRGAAYFISVVIPTTRNLGSIDIMRGIQTLKIIGTISLGLLTVPAPTIDPNCL
jgi:hypothetical protein